MKKSVVFKLLPFSGYGNIVANRNAIHGLLSDHHYNILDPQNPEEERGYIRRFIDTDIESIIWTTFKQDGTIRPINTDAIRCLLRSIKNPEHAHFHTIHIKRDFRNKGYCTEKKLREYIPMMSRLMNYYQVCWKCKSYPNLVKYKPANNKYLQANYIYCACSQNYSHWQSKMPLFFQKQLLKIWQQPK